MLSIVYLRWDCLQVRMYKHYNFHLAPGGGSSPVSMSSTPGWLSSVDDFYLTGADCPRPPGTFTRPQHFPM